MSELYGVKIIYKYEVDNEEKSIFFEEQILTLMAESFEEAYERAENYAKVICGTHINPYDERVAISIYKIVDCFQAFDEENGVQEVYSSISRNKATLTDEEYATMLSSVCDVDEMRILRNK